MKTKSFDDYLKKRLSEEKISEIDRKAEVELKLMKSLQDDITLAIAKYMNKEEIGFNELTRRLNISPSKLAKIQKGEANLTIASIAHIFALMEMNKVHIVAS